MRKPIRDSQKLMGWALGLFILLGLVKFWPAHFASQAPSNEATPESGSLPTEPKSMIPLEGQGPPVNAALASDSPGGKLEDASAIAGKIEVLKEILRSRSDNDPRLDTEFVGMSPEFKRTLRDLYFSKAKEELNDRGTLVFLLGRELESPEDFEFLDSVLKEPACVGFQRCSTPLDNAELTEHGSDTTLAYPQLVALKGLEKSLNQKADGDLKAWARKILASAEESNSERVRNLAKKIKKDRL